MVAVQFLEMRNLGHSGLSHPRSKTSAARGNDTESAKGGGEVSFGPDGWESQWSTGGVSRGKAPGR